MRFRILYHFCLVKCIELNIKNQNKNDKWTVETKYKQLFIMMIILLNEMLLILLSFFFLFVQSNF